MFTADLFERVVRTFVVSFVTTFGLVFAAPSDVTNAGAWKAAAIAAVLASVSAAGSAVLALITKNVGPSKATASMVAPTPAATNVYTFSDTGDSAGMAWVGGPTASQPVASAPAASSGLDTSGLVTLQQQGIDPRLGLGGGDYPKNTNAAGG